MGNLMTTTTLTHFQPDEIIAFDQCGSWPASRYLLDKVSAYALEMAMATGRPLLVKGEPGTGKSYLARAAAAKLQRKFITEVINVSTEGQDLLWRYDPVARLNDAQEGKKGDELNPKHYLNPGVLWWTFGWNSADTQYKVCRHKVYRPLSDQNTPEDNGIVLLIDEIDKAEPSLPNSLLEVLGNGGFDVPLLGETVGGKHGDKKTSPQPLVIITTNDERELPPAFVRRCLVLHLKVDDNRFEDWLLARANVHFTDAQCPLNIKQHAAQQLQTDRKDAEKHSLIKSGLAEYLDLLKALDEMTDKNLQGEDREAHQSALLAEIKDFVLKKAL